MRNLERMQQDAYDSEDEFEDEEDATNLHDEIEGASASAELLEQEMTEAAARPTPASTVTRLPCAAHKVKKSFYTYYGKYQIQIRRRALEKMVT